MNKGRKRWRKLLAASSLLLLTLVPAVSEQAEAGGTQAVQARQMESLARGLVAVKTGNGVFVSWRLLGTEPSSVSFNVYRNGRKLNNSPITSSTNYQDAGEIQMLPITYAPY